MTITERRHACQIFHPREVKILMQLPDGNISAAIPGEFLLLA
jgi:hypothetical protein